MGTSITDFLDAFSNRQNLYGMHLPVLWTVSIDGPTAGSINTVINKAQHKWASTVTALDMTSEEGTILVAQAVTLPNENSGFSAMTVSNTMGGYLPGYAMDARSNFLERSFSINFIETETDILHQFFRPWMIAIGIQGLIEAGPILKATIEVIQWSNGPFGQQEILRGFRFRKAFPTAVEGYTLDYANTDFPIKSVTFACQDYEQINPPPIPRAIVVPEPIPEGTVTMGNLVEIPITPEK